MASGESAAPTFACHRCGACCTDLRERGTPRGFAEIDDGLYRRAGEGGLRVFAWEAEAFPDERLDPAIVVADAHAGEQLVLAHELAADTCPRFDRETTRCTIYEDRPLVCQAFPLLVEPDGDELAVAASSICGARVPLADLDGEALAHAYPQASGPARAIPAAMTWMRSLVAFLAQAGLVAPAEGLGPDEIDRLETRCFVDRLEAEDVLSREAVQRRVAELVERAQPGAVSPATDA